MQGKNLAFFASFGKAAGTRITKIPKPFAPALTALWMLLFTH